MSYQPTGSQLESGASYHPAPLIHHTRLSVESSNSSIQPDIDAQPESPSADSQPPADESPVSPATLTQSETPNTLPYTAPESPPSSAQPAATGKFGIGELPMPLFSLESVGVMPTGGVDHSVKLNTAERAEKVIKVGVVCFTAYAS